MITMSETITNKIANIEIFTLIIFTKVYETKSIGKAAILVNSNSPKVSRAISLLRNALDDELFYRRKYGLVPTPVADRIYSEIMPAINVINSSLLSKKNIGGKKSMVIHVSPLLMPIIPSQISLRSSELGIDAYLFIIKSQSKKTKQMMMNGEVDIVLSLEEISKDGIKSEKVGVEESLYLAASVGHELWKDMDNIDLHHLSRYNFMYMSSVGFNDRIDPFHSYCIKNSIEMKEVLEVENHDELIANIKTGRFFAFVATKAIANHVSLCKELKVKKMPDDVMNSLHNSLMKPSFFISYFSSINDEHYLNAVSALKNIYAESVLS